MRIKPQFGTEVSFLNNITLNNDLIFNTRVRHTSVSNNLDVSIMDDPYYKNPDKEQYIFSTMGRNVFAMHHSNMVTPIRSKATLNNPRIYTEIGNRINKQASITNGVFIVDIFHIHNDGSNDLEKLFNYYLNTDNIDYSAEILQSIKEEAYNMYSYIKRSHFSLRIVTFISESEINKYGYIYSKTGNVVIMKDDMNGTMHPQSSRVKENNFTDLEDVKNIISIEIIDNKKSIPYYVKIGNEIITLFPTRDETRKEECNIKVKRNNLTVEDIKQDTISLEDIGIFKSFEEAEANGDIRNKIEEKKLQLELDKVKLTYEQLEFDNKRLRNDYEMLLTKYKHDQLKFKHEKDMLELKESLGITKAILEIKSQKNSFIINSLNMVNKVRTDIITSKINISKSIMEFNNKSIELKQKQSIEFTKILKDVVKMII